MKIKVLHVIGGLNAGGAETAVVNWLKNIDRNKYQFDFVIHTKDEFYRKKVENLGCKIYRLPNPQGLGLMKWLKKFENLLVNNKYDIVHSHLYFFNGLILKSAKKMSVPIRISHSHNENSRLDNTFVKIIYQKHSRFLIKKYATHLIGCSNGALKNLYANISKNDQRLSVLHYGIDVKKFDIKQSKNTLRKKYQLTTKSRIYLHVGRFVPVKNHTFLIRIFQEILRASKNSILILVGDGKLKKEVEKMVKLKRLEDNVRFVGTSDKIPEWMQIADIMIFPSLFEGLPVTLIEAQASGLNCIISDKISREIDAGLGLINFFSLDLSPKIWAKKAIDVSIKKPKQNDIENMMAKKEFDISSVCKKLEKIYEQARNRQC